MPLLFQKRDEQSGRILGRKGLTEVLDLLESGQANVLFIWDVDRLSRKYTGFAGLRERLHVRGIKIYISRDRKWVSPSAKERLGDDIRALVGDVEWETIRERMIDGAERKINEKRQVYGAGHPPFGYKWEGYKRDRRLVIDDDNAKIVQLIFELYVNGPVGGRPLAIPQVVHYLNDRQILPPAVMRKNVREQSQRGWVVNTVNRILRRTAYYGEFEHYQHRSTKDEHGVRSQITRAKSERVRVPCPAIIDKTLWEAAQGKLDVGRTNASRNIKYEYLMARRLRCTCGYACTAAGGAPARERTLADGVTPRKPKRRWYKCVGKQGKIHAVRPCTMPNIAQDCLDDTVWAWVKAHLTDPEWVGHKLREERDNHDVEQVRLHAQIDALLKEQEQIEQLVGGLFVDKNRYKQLAPIIERQIESETAKLERINTELDALQPLLQEQLTDDEIDAVAQWVARYRQAAEHATFAERRQFIELMDVRGIIIEEDDELCVKLTCRLPVEGTVRINCLPASFGAVNSFSCSVAETRFLLYRTSHPHLRHLFAAL